MSYTFLPQRIYRMPTHFGPTPSPRQRPDGDRYESADSPEIVSYGASFLTDAAQLRIHLPPRFDVRGESIVTVEMSTIRRVDFLAGRGYNVLGVYFPVTFGGRDGRVHGDLLAVLWESMTGPIISGRDELGFAKIYADIPDPEEHNGAFRCRAAWDTHGFCELTVSDLRPAQAPAKPADYAGLLHFKYIPATGNWGEPDVAYVTLTPAAAEDHGYPSDGGRRIVAVERGAGAIAFKRATWEQMPTQFHIVNALAELPIHSITGAYRIRTVGNNDLRGTRRVP